MMSRAYSLTLTDPVLNHLRGTVLYLNDRANPRDPKLDAYVRSGDYFVTLATIIENLAAELPETSVVASSLALARLADELLYIQKHYQIVPKPRSDDTTERS